MNIGVPREIKEGEDRVALTPRGVAALVKANQRVTVQSKAGEGSLFSDHDYLSAGASIVTAEEVWSSSDFIVKVKEPVKNEYRYFRDDMILFTYLHLAANHRLAAALIDRGVTAIAYETVQTESGHLPFLAPMSEIAGRVAVQFGAVALSRPHGGSGVLIGGAPGVAPAKVVIIGGGTVGYHSALIALGMQGDVTVFETSAERIRYLESSPIERARILQATRDDVESDVESADLVIGSVLVPGARAPHVLSREAVARMRARAVLVDVSIDQGGCFETSVPTSHAEPFFVDDGVVHCCVTNMPGAYPNTATKSLTNATFPYIESIAASGLSEAVSFRVELAAGVNTNRGHVAHPALANELGVAHRGYHS